MSATLTLNKATATTVVQNDTTTAVVQNDAATITAAASTTTQIAATSLIDLESKRQQWETTAYRTSNQQLYALLAECYVYGGELPFDQAKQRSAVLADFCQQRGYVVKKESPLLTRVVKAVFGNVDRRRISTYSLVLRSAKAENVLPSNLAQWIEQRGGIQEVKLARSATYISPSDKAIKAKSTLATSSNLAVVTSEALTQLADGDFMGEECVFVAEQQADGSFAIKALTRSATAVNAALLAVYGQQTKAAA
jgi:hypothetical protein